MRPTEVALYQQRLKALAKRLIGDVEQLRGEALSPEGGESSGSLSDVPLHLADLGSHAAEEDVTLDAVVNEEQILNEIAAALSRIDEGVFGRCEKCGHEIPGERLDALPYARHCVRCAQQAQARP